MGGPPRGEYSFGVIHGIAECKDCGWTTTTYKNAQATAAKHARAHGHEVHGEVAYAYRYYGASKVAAPNGGA